MLQSVSTLRLYKSGIQSVSGYETPGDGGGGEFYYDAKSTALDNKGTIIKPISIPVNQPGRWLRVFDREINVLWFGAKRYTKVEQESIEKMEDAAPAFQAAIDAAQNVNLHSGGLIGNKGVVNIPGGTYKLLSTLTVKTPITIKGDGSGTDGWQGTRLWVYHNKRGIEFIRNEDGTGARGVIARDFQLVNLFNPDNPEAHGIFTNTTFRFINIKVEAFGGNGFELNTSKSGNLNNSTMVDCAGYLNRRNGMHIIGFESNNVSIRGGDFTTNARCGILDESFLGNGYFGVHTSANGIYFGQKTWVMHNGKQYCNIWKNNFNKGIEPGVTLGWEEYWFERVALDTTIPGYSPEDLQWKADETYELGSGLAVANTETAASAFIYSYNEGGQAPVILNNFSHIDGGDNGTGIARPYMNWMSVQNNERVFKGVGVFNYDKDFPDTFSALTYGYGLTVGSKKQGHGHTSLKYFESDKSTKLFNDNSTEFMAFEILGNGHDTSRFGVQKMRSGVVSFPYAQGFFAGNAANGNESRRIFFSSEKPTTDEHAAGERCFNIGLNPKPIGWMCSESGTPGTWVEI